MIRSGRESEMSNIYSAQARAYHHIKNKIGAGKLRAGEIIDTQMVCDELQISRIPVREAVVQLISEGFLTSLQNRRVIVTEIGPAEINELFEMRAVLEGLAARRATSLISKENLGYLKLLIQRMQLVERQPDAWVQLHSEFHLVLCAEAAYPYLLAEIERLHSRLLPYHRLYNTAYHRLEMQSSDHLSLVEALEHGDPLDVERVMRDHIITAGQELVRFSKMLSSTSTKPQMDKVANG